MSESNSPVARRSQRTRRTTRKHADTVQWTEETMQMLRASSDSSDRSSTSTESLPPQEGDDLVFEDVPIPNDEEEIEEDTEQEQMSDVSTQPGSLNGSPQLSKAIRPRLFGAKIYARTNSNLNSRAQLAKVLPVEKGLRNRMSPDGREILRGYSNNIYQQNYGPDVEDLYPILQARDVWHIQPRDATLPSRRSISAALRLLPQGYLQLQTDKAQLSHTPSASANLKNSQALHAISLEQAIQEKYLETGPKLSIILGPWNSAQKYELEHLNPFNVSELWMPQLDKFDVPVSNASKAKHRAWLINTGARPQCAVWAYCNSKSQYLAVSFRCSQKQRAVAISTSSSLAPAFSPSPQFPAHVQIWQVSASLADGETPALIDFDTKPTLSQVLCMKWGNILRCEWVPLLQDELGPDMITRTLTILTSDGQIRLIDIELRLNKDTAYMVCDTAKIVLKPPSSTIYTTFCFASSFDIVVGAADGTIHIYNLEASVSFGNDPRPYVTSQIHSTYIMSLAVPPELPYYVCSSSAGGDLMLTDLRSPNIDKLAIHKARLPTRNLSYLPFIRTFITTNDAAGNSEPSGTTQSTVISHSLRHFQHANTITKLPEASGLTTCLATSTFHPCILVANAQGSVFATNHLRRYMPVSTVGSSWMQKIFEYDWQPLSSNATLSSPTDPQPGERPIYQFVPVPSTVSESMAEKESMDIYHGGDVRAGISRIHEGFRPERVDLSVPGRSLHKKQEAMTLSSTQVVFHAEQAVTAMAWNPNPKFAGWAVVAWGSGFLRIQDLSHDMP